MSNKVIQVVRYSLDAPEQAVEVHDAEIPEPGQGEVLVNLYLRPVNPADVFSLQGVYPGFHPPELPAVPGLEGVGRVVRSGSGATAFKEGQRVVSLHWGTESGNGTWQQYATTEEGTLFAVPDGVSDADAAQFPVNPLTAYGLLDAAESSGLVGRGKGWVLATAASSTLGHMIIRLAKKRGIRTVAVVRRQAHVDDVLKLGADAAVVVTGEEGQDVAADIRTATGGDGVNVTLDCVGGDGVEHLVRASCDGGLVIVYGAMGGFHLRAAIPDITFRAVTLRGWWIPHYLAEKGEQGTREVGDAVLALIADGTFASPAGRIFKLEDVRTAVTETNKPERGRKFFLEG